MDYRHMFVVDTDKYSGNFEREMCAYMTGHIGDCEVGEEEAKLFREFHTDLPDGLPGIIKVSDDHGCFRPCVIMPTPGFVNNGNGKIYRKSRYPKGKVSFPSYQSVGVYFDAEITEEVVELMKKRAKEFAKLKNIKILGFRKIKRTVEVEEEEC